MGNYVPQFYLPGASGAAVTGLFIHDLVGLFVTPLGWGLMYYFVPVILRKPIWSHAVSLIGFWGLAFFYPLNGVHHYLWSPIPMFAQYGAVVATVGVEIVVTTVFINFIATLRGSGRTWPARRITRRCSPTSSPRRGRAGTSRRSTRPPWPASAAAAWWPRPCSRAG